MAEGLRRLFQDRPFLPRTAAGVTCQAWRLAGYSNGGSRQACRTSRTLDRQFADVHSPALFEIVER